MTNQESGAHPAYRVVLEGGQAELVEKKSRFIATIRPVMTEREAVLFVEEMKKKYWDARHNCSAFVIGSRSELTRCSDDGEPAGTAGRPMLEALLQEEICNTAVVVTRYFGGILLGTGGLARAYSGAVREGLGACKVGIMRYGIRLFVDIDYTDLGRLLYLMEQKQLSPEHVDYTDTVRITLVVALEKAPSFLKQAADVTGARARFTKGETFYFVDKN